MSNRITIDELKSYLWESAVFLRTSIDAGAYKQYIFPLLFFKRICDVYDEETQKAVAEYGDDIELYPERELHTFIVPKGHHWNDVRGNRGCRRSHRYSFPRNRKGQRRKNDRHIWRWRMDEQESFAG